MKSKEEYLDFKKLSGRSSISVRSFRDYIKDPSHPLPYYKLAGKNLVKWSEFEEWISRYKVNENFDVDEIIRGVCEK
jgi:predicted DNA-binding transcriptional regulator AlpA